MLDSVLSILKETVEYKNWGWNALTIGALGTLAFTILEAWGLYKQNQKIWCEKSGESLSVILFSYFLFDLMAFIFYGVHIKSAASIINAVVLSVFYVPVLLGLWKFKGFSKKEKWFSLFFISFVPAMIFLPWKNEVFLIVASGSVLAMLSQANELWKKKGTGVVEIRLLLIFFLSTVFWIIYSYAIKNWPLEILTTAFMVGISVTIILWLKYYFTEKRARV